MKHTHWIQVLLAVSLASATTIAFGRDWYVQAGAEAGNGLERTPFNSLAAAQSASVIGDTIFVLPAPLSTPALGGGIILKDDQKLIGKGRDVTSMSGDSTSDRARITNTLGDAITLANRNHVRNLHVADPMGGAVLAVDKTKGKLSNLLLTRSVPNLVQRFDQSLCSLVTDATGTVIDYANTKLVGCAGPTVFFRPSPQTTATGRKAAINLLAEAIDGDFDLTDILVEDLPTLPSGPTRLWQAGLEVRATGNATLKVKVNEMTSSRSIRGVMALTFYQGKLDLKLDKLTVLEPINDGIGIFVEFFCAGLPPTFSLVGPTCQQIGGYPIPQSRSEAVVSLDRYMFTGLERPVTGNNSNAMGVELGQQGGTGASRIEFHMENSVIRNAPLAGIDLEQVLGSLSPDSIIDLGCVSSDCKRRGFTSKGNNKIYDNGINGMASIYGGIAARHAQLGNMQIQMIFNGSDNNVNNNIVYAQNNYWGANPVSPATCYSFDFNNNRVGPLFPTANCMFWTDYFYQTPSYFDPRFPQLTLPAQSQISGDRAIGAVGTKEDRVLGAGVSRVDSQTWRSDSDKVLLRRSTGALTPNR